jgi:DNA-binding FrmR family transcriptional regulator
VEIRQKYRLRVETCLGTIIDVHKSIQCANENQKILDQFEALRKAVVGMDMAQVSEQDIVMVEKATNALLCEYRPVFQKGAQVLIYTHIRH